MHNLPVNPILRNGRASFNTPMEEIYNGVTIMNRVTGIYDYPLKS